MDKNKTFATDNEEIIVESAGQTWEVSWHPPDSVPDGVKHGSAGVCITPSGEVILVSGDGNHWDIPAGRPEGDESWEEALRREMTEEACVEVGDVRLLGFTRGHCVQGREEGLILIRSIWMAHVIPGEWAPKHETLHRRILRPREAMGQISSAFIPFIGRAFQEARLL